MATAEEFFSLQRDYWDQVAENDGFDLESVSVPSSMIGRITGLIPYDCVGQLYPYPILVNLYAKAGLHRYNMLQGTNFKLASLIKFNMLQNCVSSFYMTLLAHDPADSSLEKTFQVQVDEQKYGTLDMGVSIARPKGEVTSEKPFIPHSYGGAFADDDIFKGELPDWPSDGDLKDETRFYVVKESEWRATDWIFMYLELAVCANDRSITDMRQKTEVMSQLEIVKVAIETANGDVEPPIERLKAKSANVYITFKGLEEPRAPRRLFEVGVDLERKAIVRRVIDEHTGDLKLVGKLCGGQYHKRPWLARQKREETQSCEKRARLG
ncbi:PREDICTED: UPF0725 protein At1g23970 [Camelina sativa]|uniref:UPF0725 protein At1g23970 n=1 Tax=Camelina sativa TaxID=90675 RepID=A0ABM0VTF6_CAMSA|nr:PREDICTED: UPF0725 protein At1g23970 [Camelina sativa]